MDQLLVEQWTRVPVTSFSLLYSIHLGWKVVSFSEFWVFQAWQNVKYGCCVSWTKTLDNLLKNRSISVEDDWSDTTFMSTAPTPTLLNWSHFTTNSVARAMSTSMRTTLQTVPESTPADHVTNSNKVSILILDLRVHERYTLCEEEGNVSCLLYLEVGGETIRYNFFLKQRGWVSHDWIRNDLFAHENIHTFSR